MNYDAIGLGPDDVTKAPSDDLAQIIVDNRLNDNQFVCANVVVLDEFVNQPFRVINSGEKTIGVTSLIGDEHLDAIKDNALTKMTMAEALKAVAPKLKACLLYTSPSPRDRQKSRMPSSA